MTGDAEPYGIWSVRLVPTSDPRALWLGGSEPPYTFASPARGTEFALLLVVGDSEVGVDAQAALSEQFVRAGCRYAICFGPKSSTWDDSIDMVSVMDEVYGKPGPFIMTVWFDDAPLSQAVAFFAHCTEIDDWVPEHLVVFVLGGGPELEAQVHQALLDQFI